MPQRKHSPLSRELYSDMKNDRKRFWTDVYPLYMQRDMTRSDMRDLVDMGLQETHGSYRMVAELFNIAPRNYKRLLNFLRKHDCQLPFMPYRQA